MHSVNHFFEVYLTFLNKWEKPTKNREKIQKLSTFIGFQHLFFYKKSQRRIMIET